MILLKLFHALIGLTGVALFCLGSLQFYVDNPAWIGTQLLAALCLFVTRQVYLAILKREAGYILHRQTRRLF